MVTNPKMASLENNILEEKVYDSRPRFKAFFEINDVYISLIEDKDEYRVEIMFPWGETYRIGDPTKSKDNAEDIFTLADLRYRQGYVPFLDEGKKTAKLIIPKSD
ncbi:hypothetical protein GOV11_00635 [Candidatus Woesearchaeota archaeon]|nr:hypothetical protein [Candidatus Woesearchaeota archaeon]